MDIVKREKYSYSIYRTINFSEDGKKISFADNEGVKIYDFDTDQITLIKDTAPVYSSEDILNSSSVGSTQIVQGGKKLFCKILGYEHVAGYYLCDLSTGESKTYTFTGGYGSDLVVDNDKALLLRYRDKNIEYAIDVEIDFKSENYGVLGKSEPIDSGNLHQKYANEFGTATIYKNVGQSRKFTFEKQSGQQPTQIPLSITVPKGVGVDPIIYEILDNEKVLISIRLMGEQILLLA